eukprot:gene6907-12518_t
MCLQTYCIYSSERRSAISISSTFDAALIWRRRSNGDGAHTKAVLIRRRRSYEGGAHTEAALIRRRRSTVGSIPPKKKKKKEYRDKDTDLMSAFIDKPEEEVVETSPEEIEEGEIKEEPVIEEETWEDKDIKTDDDVSKAEKGRCYDRDFLLRFRFSTEKPKDLPNMDIILREANEPTKLEKER